MKRVIAYSHQSFSLVLEDTQLSTFQCFFFYEICQRLQITRPKSKQIRSGSEFVRQPITLVKLNIYLTSKIYDKQTKYRLRCGFGNDVSFL